MADRPPINRPVCYADRADRPGARFLTVARDARLGVFWAAMASVLLATTCTGETLRVTTWNLGMGGGKSTRPMVNEAAVTLRMLKPDVILLQGVQDWHTCEQLAEALKPLDYNVALCSAFRSGSALEPARSQVAILANRKAYFTWSESWQSQNERSLADGVAFAAIEAGTQRLGFFSGLFSGQQRGEGFGHRLLEEVNALGRWETNQVQTFVIAASLDPFERQSSRALSKAKLAFEAAGLVDATEEMPTELKVTVRPASAQLAGGIGDCLFAGPMGFPSNARITRSLVSDHYPVTCDIELDADKVVTAQDIRAEEHRQRDVNARLSVKEKAYWLGFGLAILAVIWMVARKRAKVYSAPSSHQRVRVPRRNAPSPLRPIIPVQVSTKQRASGQSALPQAGRPVVRLQLSTRTELRPAIEKLPTSQRPPVPPIRERSDVATRQDSAVSSAPVVAGASNRPDASARESLVKELASWLKQKLVRKLMTDRAQLVLSQQLATHLATTLDNRLARIEAQIQQQNQAYMRRIEELSQELAVAREENRELIRERIAQVKAEMEAARARVLAEADLDNTSLRL